MQWNGSNTLVMTLAALKQCKLARIVHHSKLLQQSLDDFASRSTRADVQVFGCILWQVERGAALHSRSLPPSSIMSSFLRRWNWHRTRQLKLHLYEASVGTILVLLRKKITLHWRKNTFTFKMHELGCKLLILTMFMNRLLLIWALYSFTFCWISAVVNSCFFKSICSS